MKFSSRTLSIALAFAAAIPLGLYAQRGGFGGPMQQQRKILAQFDKNGDKRLDATERKAAREWLATQPAGGFGGFGRRGGPFAGAMPTEPGRKLAPADVKSYSAAPVYDPTIIRTAFLQFESNDWEQELAAFNNTDVDVPAVVTIDGKAYKDVGVHFRGMSSYFMVPEGRKRSLNLSFDFADEKQVFNGYKTLNLLNAASDPSFLRAVLYTEISSHYVPTPKMNYMRVVINGESWGSVSERRTVQQGLHARLLQIDKGRPLENPGQPWRAGRVHISRRQSRRLQTLL